MARKKEQSAAAEKAAEPVITEEVQPVAAEATPEVEEPVKASKTEFAVFDGEAVIRSYSIVEHGDKAYELANEFANKKGYQVR